MNQANMVRTAAWAMGTFALVLTVGLPRMLDAVDAPAMGEAIVKPTLKVGGIEFSIDFLNASTRPSEPPFEAGQVMGLRVNAVNNGAVRDAVPFSVRVQTLVAVAGRARVASTAPPMMASHDLWWVNEKVTLDPGKQASNSFNTIIVPPGTVINVVIQSGERQIQAYSFTTAQSHAELDTANAATRPTQVIQLSKAALASLSRQPN